MTTTTTEFEATIYTEDGRYFIRPDPDGLGLIEVGYAETALGGGGEEFRQSFLMLPEHIVPLTEALLAVARANKMIP